jgi:CheY-like chemotaxis protein
LATILIVDDEELILGILRAYLKRHNYTVLEASDGVKALNVLRHEQDRVNLVITDVQMPQMNGFELGEQLRTEYPRLPVIYMSGYATQNVVKRARELRNTQVPEDCVFLTLPFSEEELLRVVHTVLALE